MLTAAFDEVLLLDDTPQDLRQTGKKGPVLEEDAADRASEIQEPEVPSISRRYVHKASQQRPRILRFREKHRVSFEGSPARQHLESGLLDLLQDTRALVSGTPGLRFGPGAIVAEPPVAAWEPPSPAPDSRRGPFTQP